MATDNEHLFPPLNEPIPYSSHMAASENEADEPSFSPVATPLAYLQKFRLYETRSKYYMVGRDKSRRHWRVLKIDRLEASELNIREDFTTYTENECSDLLRTIHEGNRSTGGLKFVTTCYGIVGFIKFLGPYYMLLITKRRPIGSIGGHTVYAISKTEMISLSDTVTQSNLTMLRHENRYKKLLCMVDLTKDFFFSYSYHVMCSLQKNSCNDETRQVLYETMFVWNEFLTRGIRNFLQNTMWTVALVYGFFKQDKLSISGRDFRLTLISRRSRHYAGTRYLKRGVNEKGRVANDVETEQILFEDVPDGFPMQISSVVQNRGSIPLFWSQETSRLNIKPDIMLSRRDQNYEATRLHFQNLVKRYGNPIIILNLIKTNEKRPRESILRTEFANAIKCINKDLSEENHLKFLHWDLHKHSRSKGTNALLFLGRLTAYALTLTGFFYCQVVPVYRSEGCLRWPCFENVAASNLSASRDFNIDDAKSCDSGYKNTSARQENYCGGKYVEKDNSSVRLPMFQKGILRTNCIDCLDRTNVAQYAYGLAALGRQLHALGAIGSSEIDLDNPLAEELMGFYERMGDTLAHQYGGSAAHNKVFSERRGQWKAATQSQEFFRTLQRYYNNAYMDAEKQNAINVFLGHFQPQDGKPEVWELDSDQHFSAYRNGCSAVDKDGRSLHKKSLSDGNIIRESKLPTSSSNIGKSFACSALSDRSPGESKMIFGSKPEISTCDSGLTCSREPFGDLHNDGSLDEEKSHSVDCSNFVDLDWLSSSLNSCEEQLLGRSLFARSSMAGLSPENAANEIAAETTPSTSESSIKGSKHTAMESLCDDYDLPEEFSDSFLRWINNGETLCH
ncbi:phosphoinositide phosphatase SAC2-like isoform X1 [Cynara cardunculus var. scolymus]|uniref:phosphoinositide phosphatase SAC2-like isoform X1 n=1 Tax=Cynara cardunculus var. scolymus TaxID=59895 RepID=UPI000D63098C|nr:phosphoinositide phosphatase SAC2-like isoform X1 [Cynara cardunculus var. scolymus]